MDNYDPITAKGLSAAERARMVADIFFANPAYDALREGLRMTIEGAIDAAVRDAVAPFTGGPSTHRGEACPAAQTRWGG